MIKLFFTASDTSLEHVRAELTKIKSEGIEEVACPETIKTTVVTPFITSEGERFYGPEEIEQFVAARLSHRASFA